MADRLWQPIWHGQYKNERYGVYPILKDNDHLYEFWYVVMYNSTYYNFPRTEKKYKLREQHICMFESIDIRTLSTYVPPRTIHESGTKEYIVPIIRNAIKKGEIKPI